jgi:DNA repair exonuclease SbcCD ATPase subunit
MELKEAAMDAEIFLRLINEIDFVLDDIAELKDQLQLTKSESSRLSRAVAKIEESKDMLRQLFPAIQSLDDSVREDLESELAGID